MVRIRLVPKLDVNVGPDAPQEAGQVDSHLRLSQLLLQVLGSEQHCARSNFPRPSLCEALTPPQSVQTNAYVSGMREDVGLVGNDLNYLNVAYYTAYVSHPSSELAVRPPTSDL